MEHVFSHGCFPSEIFFFVLIFFLLVLLRAILLSVLIEHFDRASLPLEVEHLHFLLLFAAGLHC